MAPSRKRKQKVHVHFLGFPGTCGIGALSARVTADQVTNYVRKGAAKLELREQIRNKGATGMVDKGEGMVEYQMGAGLLAILKMKISTCNFKIEMMEIPSSLFTQRQDRRLTIGSAERQIGNLPKPYLPI